jgi:hypothetical protein
MMNIPKKVKWKIGQTKIKMRKIGGKKRKVKVTKMPKGKYKTRVVKKKR